MFDIAQAAIGMDGSGPVEFTPAGYNGQKYASMKYANGIVMTEQPYRKIMRMLRVSSLSVIALKKKNIIRAAYAFEQSREFVNWSLNGKEEK